MTSERTAVERERDGYRQLLVEIRATCDARVAGETRRASYLGIRNAIDRLIPPVESEARRVG